MYWLRRFLQHLHQAGRPSSIRWLAYVPMHRFPSIYSYSNSNFVDSENADQAHDTNLPLKEKFFILPLPPTNSAQHAKFSTQDIIAIKLLIDKMAWLYVQNGLCSLVGYSAVWLEHRRLNQDIKGWEEGPQGHICSALWQAEAGSIWWNSHRLLQSRVSG